MDGIPEALSGGQAGMLVPPSGSQSLVAALSQLLRDPKMLHRWKDQAQQNLQWLTTERVNEETWAVYRELTTKDISS